MRSLVLAAGLAVTTLGVAGCAGDMNATPTAPGPTTAAPAGAITINIVGINGAQSFSPNPATVPPEHLVVWHNVDSVTHRVVLNDGQLDTGSLAPGVFSAPMTLRASGPYHCSIHPPMVGTLVGAG